MAKEQEVTEHGDSTVEATAFKPTEDYSIRLNTGNEERIRIEADGKFYVNEKLVETDRQVYEGFVAFLKDAGWY